MTNLKIGDEIFVHGYVDEIRHDTIIVKNEGGYFGTVESEITPVRRKKGEWVHGREIGRDYMGDVLIGITYEDWRCSECKIVFEQSWKPTYKFCPNCGAEMR